MEPMSRKKWEIYNKLCTYQSDKLRQIFSKTARGFIIEPLSPTRLTILDLIWMIFKARSPGGKFGC